MNNTTAQPEMEIDTLAADCGDAAVQFRTLADDAQDAAEYIEWLSDIERNQADLTEKEFEEMRQQFLR